jgi:hypothetical protein
VEELRDDRVVAADLVAELERDVAIVGGAAGRDAEDLVLVGLAVGLERLPAAGISKAAEGAGQVACQARPTPVSDSTAAAYEQKDGWMGAAAGRRTEWILERVLRLRRRP